MQIGHGLGSDTENGLYLHFDKKCTFIHAADLILNGQNVVFGFNMLKGVCIGDDGTDGYDLITPVRFCVDASEFARAASSLRLLRILYRKQGRKARGIKLHCYKQRKDRQCSAEY